MTAPTRVRPPVRIAGNASQNDRFLMFVMDEMAAEHEQHHDDVVRLTLGKSELPPVRPVVDVMVDAAGDYAKASRVHPAGLPELKERLSAEYRQRYGVPVPAENIVVSTGTSTLFRNIFSLLVAPGEEVVVPLPYYPLYVFAARLAGAVVRYYRVDLQTMEIDLDSLAAVVGDRTRAVVVNSPGNPLGNIVGPDAFRRIDEVVAGRAVVISDEIYGNVQFDGDVSYTSLQLADALTSPLIITNSFSKGHRMYARRVGYAVVPAELAQPLAVVQHHTLLTADPVAQFGAIAALDHAASVDELTDLYRARRDHAMRRFAEAPGVRPLPSRGGFYLALDCAEALARDGSEDSFALAQDLMREVHVATVPGSDFGLPTTLRLSFTAAHFDDAVDRMAGFFEQRHR